MSETEFAHSPFTLSPFRPPAVLAMLAATQISSEVHGMNRHLGRLLALIAVVLLPSVANAQKEPPHTKETKNAEKFIGLAMTRQEAAAKKPFLEQALAPLQEAIQKNP